MRSYGLKRIKPNNPERRHSVESKQKTAKKSNRRSGAGTLVKRGKKNFMRIVVKP